MIAKRDNSKNMILNRYMIHLFNDFQIFSDVFAYNLLVVKSSQVKRTIK